MLSGLGRLISVDLFSILCVIAFSLTGSGVQRAIMAGGAALTDGVIDRWACPF